MVKPRPEASYLTLLRNGNFLRFFLAQFVSSLGDWVGVIAIAVLASNIGGNTAVGAVMTARVLPGFIVGPLAGVLADRWDRKRTMVTADILRALVIFSLPFAPNLPYLLLASVILESLTLVWGPAKDASLPNFVSTEQLTHANSLSLIGVYGPWPLASIVYFGLSGLGGFLGEHVHVLEGLRNNEAALALWVDALTFGFSAAMVSTLSITSSLRRNEHLDFSAVKRDLVEGLGFVMRSKQVRPWLLGIAFTFTAAGAVFSLGIGFVKDVLHGGDQGFASLIGFLAVGMITGLLAVGVLAKKIQKDVLFSSSILLLGVGLIGLASMNSLQTGIPIASALGFFGGVAYSTGYALMHETTSDEMRGRTFSAAYTVIRVGTLVGLGLFPLLAGAIGDHSIGGMETPGTRITLWIAGLVAVGGGLLSMRAIGARAPSPSGASSPNRGHFVVFEGGEGAGKSTQMAALAKWLEARGEDVVVTREPGGTEVGTKIRDLLLDPLSDLDPRTEALLYAADRAQHVAEVIRPALEAGKTVVSDRFIDSSLAYQGLARGLGVDEIYQISDWAIGGLLPDIVFYLKLDPAAGLERVGEDRDRMEQEGPDFHGRVSRGYLELAEKFPARFIVLDGSKPQQVLHQEIVRAFEERRVGDVVKLPESGAGRPGPLPR
ncbi:MAG: dTMP kinase [Actinomycetota bacterium]|nr:dTMP kinase [Actinomycetota bacterium]